MADVVKPFVCRPYFKLRDGHSYKARIVNHLAPASYTPIQVAKAYGIPTFSFDGSGQTVGIIELGGAWSGSDYAAYMISLGLKNFATPMVLGSPQPDPGGADVEVMLDSCIVGGIAPRASQRIYFAPNSDVGFTNAINQAVNDKCDVISISWGGPEGQWPSQARAGMDAAMGQAVSNGVNVYVACGDNGSSDGASGNNVDYPASSPYAIGCGGTNLQLGSNGAIVSETVWNDGSMGGATGGGYSIFYHQPSYQQGRVNGSMRGVPDVTGVGDPESGWSIRANGREVNVGGTSAVAPMWAAIQCLLNQKAGRRVENAAVYYQNPKWFRDTITGNNGSFNAGPNWDACSGMGSPSGATLFAALDTQPTPTPPTPIPQPPTPTPIPIGNLQLGVALNSGYYALHPLRGPGRYSVLHALDKCTPGNYKLNNTSGSELLSGEIVSHLNQQQVEAVLALIAKYGPEAATLIEDLFFSESQDKKE